MSTETANTFGKKVFQLRKQRQWSQPQLGKLIGTSGTIVGRYERGEMTPSIEVARKLAEAFEVTVDFLVSEGNNGVKDKAMLKRWQDLEALPQEDRDRIVYMIDGLIRDSKARQAYGQ